MRCLICSAFGRVLLFALLLPALASPALADLGRRDAGWIGATPQFSDPVPLSRYDRAVMAPLSGHLVTVYVSMNSTFLNETERNMIMETLRSKYSFASTLITFTTVQPTTGSYHTLSINPGRDPITGADGTDWGQALNTSAEVYGGEFTLDPAVTGAFSNSTARSNAIGECAAHELDHILRGRGHSKDPGDINCEGGKVDVTRRAADNRSFTAADQAQKIRNILGGKTWLPWRARDGKLHCNMMAVFGSPVDEIPDLKPDCHYVSLTLNLLADPLMFNLGFATEEGFLYFADGIEQFPPNVYSVAVPPGTRLDFAVMHLPSGEYFPISDYGMATVDLAATIPPDLSNDPLVTTPYYFNGALHWDTPFGPVDCQVQSLPPEGFQVLNPEPGGMDDRGSIGTTPRLMQNYPNPFGRSTQIAFQVPAAAGKDVSVPVRLSVFDIQGRLVTVLVDSPLNPGLQTITVTRAGLGDVAPGIYFYRLEVGSEKIARRMVLID